MMRTFVKSLFLAVALGIAGHVSLYAQSIQEGLRFLDIEQYGNAGKAFRTLASQKPSAENQFYLGYYYIQSENLDSAKIQFEKGIAADANYPLNHVGLGSVMMARGDKAGAKAQFDKALALKKASKNPEVWFRIGEAYVTHKNNDPVAAVAALQKAAELDGKNAEAFLLMGDAYKMRNEGTNAANNYDKAMSLNPKSSKAHIRYGKLMINTRNYNEALRRFNEAVQVDPNYAPAYRERGELYFLAKDYPKALADYEKYMSMSDNSAQAKFKYAGFLLLNQKYDQSLQILQEVAPNQQENPYLHRLLGYANYETKNYPQGLESINKFFSMAKPEILIASDYEYQGKLQVAAGDTTKGVENIYKAAEMDTAKVGLYAAVGETFFKARQYAKAAEAYEKAMTRGTKESNVRDMVYLGLSYLQDKNYEKADTVFGQFITDYPEQYIGFYYKAQAEAGQDPDLVKGSAKPYFEKYIELVNADPGLKEKNKTNLLRAYDYLGVYYLKTAKDLSQAKDVANKMLEIDPNNAKAKQFLQYKQSDLGGASAGSQTPKATSAKSATKASGSQR